MSEAPTLNRRSAEPALERRRAPRRGRAFRGQGASAAPFVREEPAPPSPAVSAALPPEAGDQPSVAEASLEAREAVAGDAAVPAARQEAQDDGLARQRAADAEREAGERQRARGGSPSGFPPAEMVGAAADTPGGRFVFVAGLLFVLFILILILSHVLR